MLIYQTVATGSKSKAEPIQRSHVHAHQTQHLSHHLERRVGINQQLLEIRLEPRPCLRSRLQRIRIPTVGIVPRASTVTRTITLTTRLDPNKSVEQWVTSVSARASTKASTDNIAPVAPSLLLRRLDTIAARVRDEVGRVAVLGEQRSEGVDVQLLVVVAVALGVGGRGGDGPGVVVCYVGREAADGGRRAGGFVDLREELGGGADVGAPAEPARVAGVEVGGYVWVVEGLDCVLDARFVSGLGLLAFGDVEVGDEVAETVGLCAEVLAFESLSFGERMVAYQ